MIEGAPSMETLLGERPLVAILRGMALTDAIDVAGRVWDRGIGIIEVPVQTPSSFGVLAALATLARERGEVVGAGTVTTVETLQAAVAAGAAFTVAPGLDLSVLEASHAAGLAHLPGVATASEVQRAKAAGSHSVKVFPASSLTPSWIRDMKGPFPEMGYVATGGIDHRNAADFLRAGASAVGVGSTLRDLRTAEQLFDAIETAIGASSR